MRAEGKIAELGTAPVGKAILCLSVPIVISNLFQASYNLIDGIFIANLSENALAATSLSFSVQMLVSALVSGMCTGMNAAFSKKQGEGKGEEAAGILKTAVVICLFLTGAFLLFGLFAVRPFFSSFTQDPEIIAYGVQYLSICTVFCLPGTMSILSERVLQASNNAACSLCSHAAGVVCNAVLDPILIFGLFGVEAMGIRGAAIATVVGQTVAFLLSAGFNWRRNRQLFQKQGSTPGRVSWHGVREIYRVGLPVTVMQSIGTVMTYCVNQILITYSSMAVAFFGIYYKLQMFVITPVFAFGQGLVSLIAYNFGAGFLDRVRQFRKVTTIICVGFTMFGLIVFHAFPAPLLGLFHPSPEMLRFGCRSLRILSLVFPLEAVCVTLSFSFQGLGRGDLSLIHSVIRQLVLRVPVSWLFGKLFGLNAIWYAFLVAEIVSLFLTGTICRRLDRRIDREWASAGKRSS